MYEDKEMKLKHGDRMVSIYNGQTIFFFRCGPVSRGGWSNRHYNWPKKAYGSMRRPKTLRSLRWNEAHRAEGFQIPKKGNDWLPTAWDDFVAHNEKCWKRHRKTQYHPL